MKTKFEEFKQACDDDIDAMRDQLRGRGVYDYTRLATDLHKAQNKMNMYHLIDMFGNQLGEHLWMKFLNSQRNILTWLNTLNEEYRFFVLVNIQEGVLS